MTAQRKSLVQPLNDMTVEQALTSFASENGEVVKILRPTAVFSAKSYSTPLAVPLGAAYLAALLEAAGYTTDVVDGIGEGIADMRLSEDGRLRFQGLTNEQTVARVGKETRVLGVSLMFSQSWVQHRDLITKIKQAFPDLVIVLGGEHPSSMPDYVLSDCPAVDYVIVGEGELAFLEFLWRHFKNESLSGVPGLVHRDGRGQIVKNGPGRRIADFANLPRPAWHLCDIESYFQGSWSHGLFYGRNMLILATRGCPYQCTFCSNAYMWSTRYMMRPSSEVVDEIEWLVNTYGANSIDFEDLTAIVKKEWTLEFCAELKRRNINIVWQLPSGTRSEALDTETLQALYDTNCRLLTYAPESGSEESLDVIKKNVKLDNLIRSLKTAIKIGHTTKINLIIGFPHEKRSHCWDTIKFAMKAAIFGAHDCLISVFTPYPGSPLFDQLLEQGIINKVDDTYFNDLLLQFDATIDKSYCPNIGGKELAYYRIAGMLLFYFVSFVMHPTRGFRIFGALFKRDFKAKTVLEQRLAEMSNRRRIGQGKG